MDSSYLEARRKQEKKERGLIHNFMIINIAHAILYLSLLIYNRIILSYYFTHLHNKKIQAYAAKAEDDAIC